tara:strand:- start:834 stop:977 length:144 start_codon:yes stop_codon:yes gene_type:complete
MRTYDDTFSGQKIYPGKVRSAVPHTDPPDIENPQPRCNTTYCWRRRI